MSGDICYYCDGTRERNPFSGERCLYCGGSGWIEDEDPDDEYLDEEWEREMSQERDE